MEYLRPDQMAKVLRVSKRAIYRALKDGFLDQAMCRGRMVVKVPKEIQSMESKGDRLLRPSEVADIFQCGRSSVYRWFHEDKLTGIEVLAGTLRLYESSVQAFMAKRLDDVEQKT